MTGTDPQRMVRPLDIFRAFLGLGLTSFGGPVAHLGYFRREFVERRGWLDEAGYAEIVALSQVLPGPSSSQTGFAIGLTRGGWAGGVAAWTAFTLPSALALGLFAALAGSLDGPVAAGALSGLKLLAVAVVAQAVLGMGRSLCPDRPRLAVALGALTVLALVPGVAGQLLALASGALAGLALGPAAPTGQAGAAPSGWRPSRRLGAALAGLALALLALLPLGVAAGIGGQGLALFEALYRAGALVFGGGHVVLPLLEAAMVRPGWMDADTFLAGYGAAQAVPGPLFTISAYLGAVAGPEPNGLAGAAIALVGIFLPGLLLMAGLLPWWGALRRWQAAQSALAGVNAAVVGVLAAALYDPVFTSAVRAGPDLALAALAFFALSRWQVPVWAVVLAMAAVGALRGLAGV